MMKIICQDVISASYPLIKMLVMKCRTKDQVSYGGSDRKGRGKGEWKGERREAGGGGGGDVIRKGRTRVKGREGKGRKRVKERGGKGRKKVKGREGKGREGEGTRRKKGD